ncbi:MAG: enoyl-CoA hydratase/isomerase family protein, partial [Candidatus Obscuribacterales bacterium]|nr:enoyl-CoA hydratase/isomerase family protein [Candidatus Obscuribacterales bacterium]
QADKANAMTRDFWQEFPLAIKSLAEQADLRVLVISGDGKHFCSGMDLSVFSNNLALNNSNARERERLRCLVEDLQSVFTQIEKLKVPVIATVQGACVGGGLDLISACDLRYAVSSAFFCIQEINLAMMADLGSLQRLPKLIPMGIVRELAYTGDRLSADRAYELGFLNGVFATEEDMLIEVLSVAAKIAAKSPLAISASKESINFARDNTVAASLGQAAILQSSILDVGDLEISARAMAKRAEASFDPLLTKSTL